MAISRILLLLVICKVCPALAIRCLQCAVAPTITPRPAHAPAQLTPPRCPVWNLTDCDLRPVPLGLGPYDACYQMDALVDGQHYQSRSCVHYRRCLDLRASLRDVTLQHPGSRVKITCCFQDGCNAVSSAAVTMATVTMVTVTVVTVLFGLVVQMM
ncbi:PREDICTED: uncharacterized protein LOC109484319 [Branchiostoma belcheri]|uniref:Uncharacterized protein LOC109484319 n=1 Tax=Branchiostoma belcheri TaxID=7741 RepID=A0A6P5A1G0_BRABE|nr:PREDICTED: uncharacterized protein LOC109484319 [Branchiostoma belcheri]